MAELTGFRGVRYDTARLGVPLAELVAPPYDVISPAEQEALHAKNPHNVAHLTLGQGEDKYGDAGRLFRQWLQDGTLVKEEADAVYVYRQSFRDPLTGEACPERVSLVCLLKLQEYGEGGVLPHENTLSGAKADRLALTEATGAQLEPIFGLYSDPDRAVQSFLGEYDDRESVMETVPDMIGSSHNVERLMDDDALATLQNLMQDKPVFIADGHHRYETALTHRRNVRAALKLADDASIPEDYILIALTAFEDEGLQVLPTHRLVQNVSAEMIDALPERLAQEFTVEPCAADALEQALAEGAASGKTSFGVLLPAQALLVTVQESESAAVAGTLSLPAMVLQSQVLAVMLGIGANELASGTHVQYTRDANAAQSAVADSSAQAAFVLPRPAAADVRAVSLAGERLPQKSTYFFPKLLSGLLLRDLGE